LELLSRTSELFAVVSSKWWERKQKENLLRPNWLGNDNKPRPNPTIPAGWKEEKTEQPTRKSCTVLLGRLRVSERAMPPVEPEP